VVIQHERWHIRHRHYLDVYLQEALSCLFWFNPIQWLLRKELRSIHEYETDRSVLNEGTDLYRYQTIILEEVMGNHFRLANGFNQSFTKKRFIQMKNTQNNRLAPSHKLLLVPVLTLLFAALSFVPGQSQVIKVESSTKTGQPNTNTTSTSTFTIDTVNTTNPLQLDPTRIKDPGYIQTSYLKSLDSIQQMVDKTLPVVRKLAAQTNPSANTADMNALLEAMNIKANNQGISITDLSPEVRKSFTRDDFKQLQRVLENTNDSLRMYRKQKVDRMDSPYLIRPVALAQNMMTSSFVSKLLPELFQVMSRQLSGMMQGMASSLSQAGSKNVSQEATEAGKMVGDMLGQMVQSITSKVKPEEVVIDSVRVSSPRPEPTDQSALIYVVMNDKEPKIRLAALSKLTDQVTISYAAMNDKEPQIRKTAVQKLTDINTLNYVSMNEKIPDIRLAAVNRLNELSKTN